LLYIPTMYAHFRTLVLLSISLIKNHSYLYLSIHMNKREVTGNE
jgi:hypothetical protein